MKKIKVLHVLGSLDRGGIESFLMNLYRNIDLTKFHFDFLIHTEDIGMYGQEVLDKGGGIFHIMPRNKGIWKNNKELDDFFNKNSKKYDIVHYHTSSMSYITPIVKAKKYGVKNIVLHSHNTRAGGSRIHHYLHYFNKLFKSNVANIHFACSKLAANWMFESNSDVKCSIIRNAIDIESFSFNLSTRKIKRVELGFSETNIVVGNVSRFHPQKNHFFLLDVFSELVKKNDEYRLVLVGDGALRTQIEVKIKELSLEKFVKLLGVREDINEIINAFDLVLFPSLYEGLGIVLIESQANGLPVFATKATIPEEVKILDNFQFIELKKGAKYWAELIDKSEKARIAKDAVLSSLFSEGYNVRESTNLLEEIYFNLK